MKIEQKINSFLNRYPNIKKIVKRIYQRFFYTFSRKSKFEGNIEKISPSDKFEYLFGYYDKSPWDADDKYMLALRVNETWKHPAPRSKADILLINTSLPIDDKKRIKVIAKTSSWNVQQGCMLQWLGPDYKTKIIYNDYRNQKFCSVILDINTLEEKVVNFPIYSVSNNGKVALSLDFSRLHTMRPGYGYSNAEDKTKNENIPEGPCIWKIDLGTGKIKPILYYKDFYLFETKDNMKGAKHKVNHIMINPKGNRFMVIHRWINGTRKYSRLVTCDMDGKNMYNLSDDDMISHCFWKDDYEILAFENKKKQGNGYYLMKDKTQLYEKYWGNIENDGHPSYSFDGKLVVTDSYPDRKRMQYVKIMEANNKNSEIKIVAKVFEPFKYDNDTRCDLHPRWNHHNDQICIDSVFEGKRGIYVIRKDKTWEK